MDESLHAIVPQRRKDNHLSVKTEISVREYKYHSIL